MQFSSCWCPGPAAREPCRSISSLRLRRSCCCCRSSGVSGAMQQVCAGAADRGVCSCGAHDDRRQLDPDAVLHGWSNFLLHHVAAARSRCGCSCLAFLFARWARCYYCCRRVSMLSICRTMDGHNLTLYFLLLSVRIAHGTPVSVRSCVIMCTNMGRSSISMCISVVCGESFLTPVASTSHKKLHVSFQRNSTPTFILHASLKTAFTAQQGHEHTRKPLIAT